MEKPLGYAVLQVLCLDLYYPSRCDYIAHAYKIPLSSVVVAENQRPRLLVRESFDVSLDIEQAMQLLGIALATLLLALLYFPPVRKTS